jgi:HD-GYP domain-containing protein (c-di-GMP phosphodiesterase class II)
MALKVLLADASDEWLSKAKEFLVQNQYEVETANTGKSAQLALFNINYFALVISSSLKNHNASTVIRYVKSNKPSTKIIILAENEDDLANSGLNKKILEKQGITDFIYAPFPMEKIRSAIEGHTDASVFVSKGPAREGQSEEVEVNEEDSRFTSIKIEEFRSSKAVQFDLYVKLNSGKYVKILHSGDSFSPERIDKYKNEKGVKFLYFTIEDRSKFVRVQNFMAEKIVSNEKVEVKVKDQLIRNAGEKLVEEMYSEGLKPQTLEQGKTLCSSMYEMVHASPKLSQLLKQYEEFDPSAYTHSYLVTLFTCSLIKQFEWESKIIYETLGMAALLHDIGKLKIPPNIALLDPSAMTEEELKIYKTHPELGFEMLASNNMVSAAVKQVILQHHERNDGSGYPYGLKRKKILQLSKMVGIVDDFVYLMVKDKISAPKALKKLLTDPTCVNRYSSSILESFIKIFVNQDRVDSTNKPQG